MISKVNLILATALICAIAYANSQHVGGLDYEQPADDHIRQVIPTVIEQFKGKYPSEIASIQPVSYRTQVVAGMNYFVRAIVTEQNGKKAHMHLRIYKPIRGDNQLVAFKTDVEENSPLKYFQ